MLKKTLMLLLLACSMGAPAFTQNIPAWLRTEWDQQTAGSGTWITSNDAYQSENEPFESYKLVWRYGIGKMSVTGKMYGIKEGEEVGPFWEFRSFWHPGEKKVIVEQWGAGGVYGVGEMRSLGDGKSKMSQTFYQPDGTSTQGGHESMSSEGKQVSTQFRIEPGPPEKWIKDRSYTWILKTKE